jgi:hypothetical protein
VGHTVRRIADEICLTAAATMPTGIGSSISGLSNTLIRDADGISQPALFNGRPWLALTGTTSEAELHVQRAPLLVTRRRAAKYGEAPSVSSGANLTAGSASYSGEAIHTAIAAVRWDCNPPDSSAV